MVGVANHIAKVGGLCFVAGLGLTLGGCGGSSPDPVQLGRFRPTPAVNVILDSLGVADEPAVAWENGEAPTPKDVVGVSSDYMLRPGDVVRISIFELLQEGATATNDYVVSETGKVSIPEVGVVEAAGLTEVQLEQGLKQILAPAILKNPSVSVTLVSSQQRMFAVLGIGVTQPGRYAIPRHNFRLTDALASAGGLGQFNVSHIYITRPEEGAQQGVGTLPAHGMELIEPQTNIVAPKPGGGAVIPPLTIRPGGVPQPSQPAEKFETQQEMLDLIMPSAKVKPSTQDGGQKKESRDSLQDPSSAVPHPTPDQTDVSPSVLPGGFRLVMAATPSDQAKPSRDEIVQSLTEFGGAGPASAAKPSANQDNAGGGEWVFQDGKWIRVPGAGGGQTTQDKGPATRKAETPGGRNSEVPPFVFRNGRWVRTGAEQPESTKPPLTAVPVGPTLPMEKEKPAVESEWDQTIQSRLIKIPVDRLLAGDPRYNVIVQPGDVIHVPADVVGEFCITGNVVRSGYISMTGRSMTLKQAIAAAGGLTPLAWPKYCEVVRRIGPKKEEIVMVDLDKITRGEQPDFFIKPNDLINVGTHPSAQWRAAMRNAQKSAYGVTFVYDRNFVDADYGLGQRGGS